MIILTVKSDGKFNAAPKAPGDIIEILEKNYNAKSNVLCQAKNPITKIIYRIKLFFYILNARLKNEVFIMQFPMFETSKFLNALFMFDLKFINKNKTIALIHDLGGLRDNDKALNNQDIARLKKFKYIIAHNEKMKKYLIEQGIDEKNIYVLELFDYLCKEERKEKSPNIDGLATVAYAGNLVYAKSPFIYQIEEDKLNFQFNLYGFGVDNEKLNSKIKYCGKFPPDELPNKIEANLGLIWDGNFDESDENIHMKQYTKYNNPHKLSCYVSAGIPVIVWAKSAIANFVNKNNIGYTINNINNIYDINTLDLIDYEEKLKNIQVLSDRVRQGYYTKNVIDKIIKNIKETGKINEKI